MSPTKWMSMPRASVRWASVASALRKVRVVSSMPLTTFGGGGISAGSPVRVHGMVT